MPYQIIVEPEALHDLENIYTYIFEQDSKNKATQFINELKQSIQSLDTMPLRCRKSIYNEDTNTRDHIYKGYTIVFQVREMKIYILTLFRQKSF